MRRSGIVAASLLLSSCIPSSGPRPPTREQRPSAEPNAATRQCYADLSNQHFLFRPLVDRTFDNGCSALGAVQLIDIGTPVTNLGAMTCPLADRFGQWVRDSVQSAAKAWLRSRVVKVESFGTYACRPVNGEPGKKLSEHGRSNAVDISGFQLADGRRITILADWNGPDEDVRHFLRAIHDSGCRRFQVVLGPDANAFHRNHLHMDLGNGPYCR
ncbi:MAG: extensin family protein [Alphaproteobacteria bacterium]|nr:extensin family protein [Alphaproteobacteria bacterium]